MCEQTHRQIWRWCQYSPRGTAVTTGCFLTVKYPLGKSSIPSMGALAVVIRVITEIPTHCSPPMGVGLAISYKMGPLCNWWEDRCNDGNWQRETTGRVSGEDRKLSQKEAEENNRRCCREHLGFHSWSESPLGDGSWSGCSVSALQKAFSVWCQESRLYCLELPELADRSVIYFDGL